jgi:hypothetical protein
MALKKFHLIKDRFLFDDYESGLYFDICPVWRNPGDANDFNGRIEEANDKLVETDPANQKFLCTVLLNEEHLYALTASQKGSFGAKTYLLLYKANCSAEGLPTNEFYAQGSGGMICNPITADKSKWIYYTNWTTDNLAHRFRRVTKDEVNAYVQPDGTVTPPPVTPPVDPGTPPVVPPVVAGSGYHVTGTLGGMVLDIDVTPKA